MSDFQVPDFNQLKENAKSFWQRKEGTTGMIITSGLVLVALYFLWMIMPFVVGLLTNIFTAALLVLGLVILGYITVYLGPIGVNFLKAFSRWLTNIFVTIYPLQILQEYLQRLKLKREELQAKKTELRGVMGRLKNKIATNQNAFKANMNLATAAKDQNNLLQLRLRSRRAGRLEASNVTYAELLNTAEMLYRIVDKMDEASEYYIEDIGDEIAVATEKYEMINSAHGAFSSAMSIIKGSSSEKEMYDLTMEHMANNYGSKLGEIESMIDMSNEFISGVDLQNSVFDAQALERIKEWEKKADSMILGDDKPLLIAASKDARQELDFSEPEKELVPRIKPMTATAEFEKLFNDQD